MAVAVAVAAMAVVVGTDYLVHRSLPVLSGTVALAGLGYPVTVLRGPEGFVHIQARDAADLFFAQGYVEAQDRLFQMDLMRRAAEGDLSQVLGPAALGEDRLVRTLDLLGQARREVARMNPATLRVLRSFCAGINAFIRGHARALPVQFTVLGYAPRPFRPVDVVALSKLVAWQLGGDLPAELLRMRLMNHVGERLTAELMPPYPAQGPTVLGGPAGKAGAAPPPPPRVHLGNYRLPSMVGPGGSLGSNAWVLAPRRTATGGALLANDPHLPISMPSLWYEVSLRGGGYDVSGVTFPGVPGVVIGHNARIAWGITNLGSNVEDAYVEKLSPHGRRYRFDGRWLPVRVRKERIPVRGVPGGVPFTVRVTNRGPLLNGAVPGLRAPIALEWMGLTAAPVVTALLALDRAPDFAAFRAALRKWSAPAENFVYADTAGNIGDQATGLVPVLRRGDGEFPVPGDTSAYGWKGRLPFRDLPWALNPPSGRIVSANNRVPGPGYPHLITTLWAAPWRAQEILRHVSEGPQSLRATARIQGNVTSLPARRLLPVLVAAGRGDPRLAAEVRVLARWDGRLRARSEAAAIFEEWLVHYVPDLLSRRLPAGVVHDYLAAAGSEAMMFLVHETLHPTPAWFSGPGGVVAQRDAVVDRSLQQAVEALARREGPDPARWRWGSLHTAYFREPLAHLWPLHLLLAYPPVPTPGDAYTVDQGAYDPARPFAQVSVASTRIIADPRRWNLSRIVLTTGESGNPGSPYYTDQIHRWRRVESYPWPFTPAAVARSARHRLVLLPAHGR